jgi:hypothetical protein
MSTRSTTTSVFAEPQRLLAPLALVLALGEVASAFLISFPIAGIIFAALFVAGASWVRRGGIGGAVFVAALCTFEVADYPFWQRHSTAAVIAQSAYAAVALAGLLVALAAIRHSIAGRRAGAIAAER